MRYLNFKYGLVCISVLLAIFLTLSYYIFASVSKENQSIYIYIDRDDNVDSVYTKLSDLTSNRQLIGLKISSRLLRYPSLVRSGKYNIGGGQTTFQIIRRLRGGQQTPVKVVIPIVHTLGDFSSRLADRIEADSIELMNSFLCPNTLQKLHLDSANLPCLFIPNTYEVYWNIAPEKFLLRMKREHDAFWNAKRKAQAIKLGLTTNEVYVLASIIQQESVNQAELPIIAGMYLNRLKKGMKLQADPTVKFALQDFALRRILHKHLERDSPYNTYLYEGLPQGPICIPSLRAIESVLNPAHHNYLYMCAKEDFSGTHNFASTFNEHQNNARRYARALNKRKIYK